jgi:hypothetical protein
MKPPMESLGAVPNTSLSRDRAFDRKGNVEERIHRLNSARLFHFLFMCIFSGVEFTLTFLTFDCKWTEFGLLIVIN